MRGVSIGGRVDVASRGNACGGGVFGGCLNWRPKRRDAEAQAGHGDWIRGDSRGDGAEIC